jgi:predicted negative regulator of RcsB-dependent stress response
MKKTLAFSFSLFFCGCASFTTTQTDVSYDEKSGQYRTITTEVKAKTFGTAKSELAKFKATQTDKTQGASVGSLDQQSSGTNAVAILEKMVELAKALPK